MVSPARPEGVEQQGRSCLQWRYPAASGKKAVSLRLQVFSACSYDDLFGPASSQAPIAICEELVSSMLSRFSSSFSHFPARARSFVRGESCSSLYLPTLNPAKMRPASNPP